MERKYTARLWSHRSALSLPQHLTSSEFKALHEAVTSVSQATLKHPWILCG